MSVEVPRGPAVPSIVGYRVQAAGYAWDAVRVPTCMGATALIALGERSGAVIEDPREQALYWFVARGTSADWDVAGTRSLGPEQHLVVPDRERTRGPGPRWRVGPGNGALLTDAIALRNALMVSGATSVDAGRERR